MSRELIASNLGLSLLLGGSYEVMMHIAKRQHSISGKF
jgi:hypothetical protein